MLSQNELTLLNNIQSQEELCVKKYDIFSSKAKDTQLKNLFNQIKDTEQEHYNTIIQIKNGNCPSIPASASNAKPNMTFSATYNLGENSEAKDNDKYLCSDAITNEKYVSSVYNNDIFEFKQQEIRNTLNHIQKEEQQHAEMIYNYMEANGMRG